MQSVEYQPYLKPFVFRVCPNQTFQKIHLTDRSLCIRNLASNGDEVILSLPSM